MASKQFIAHDDCAIHGLADSPEHARQDAYVGLNDRDAVDRLSVVECTPALAARVREEGGAIAWIVMDGVADIPENGEA